MQSCVVVENKTCTLGRIFMSTVCECAEQKLVENKTWRTLGRFFMSTVCECAEQILVIVLPSHA
jgi:hypothetical protein